jgi:hypothetical protein
MRCRLLSEEAASRLPWCSAFLEQESAELCAFESGERLAEAALAAAYAFPEAGEWDAQAAALDAAAAALQPGDGWDDWDEGEADDGTDADADADADLLSRLKQVAPSRPACALQLVC